MSNSEIVKQTTVVLASIPEWIDIYAQYGEDIQANAGKYGQDSRKFQPKSPLMVYSTIGKVKSGGSKSEYDLRFAGQSVGCVVIKNEKVKLNISEDQARYARDNFGFADSKALKDVEWDKEEAQDFRRFYTGLESTANVLIKSEEHRIESFLLKEFAKTTRAEEKKLCNIQPIRLGGKFFQLTTPLKGSTHVPTASLTKNRKGATGGGIDILARIRHKNGESRIAVIELKDENRKNECQEVAMFQALTYATFLAHLLRSKSGKQWWDICRDGLKNIPVADELHLDVITLMPEGNSKEGDLADITLPNLNTTFHLHTLYYKKDKERNPLEFSGTLLKSMNSK